MIPVLLVLALAAAHPDNAAVPAQQTGSSRTVLASVLDQRNQSIVDLGPDDFVISEGGEPRDVLDVRVADYPVVVLLDTSRSAGRDFDQIRAAAVRFIGRLGQRPVAVGTLGHPSTIVASFDDERSTVLDRLNGLSADAAADDETLQGVANAGRLIRDTGAPFSAIAVISASPTDTTGDEGRELLAPVWEARTIVHVVAHRTVAASSAGSGTPTRLEETLRGIAQQTGGQFTAIYSAASYQVALDRLADRLATELMVEYIVPSGPTPAGPVGDVKLGVRVPGARARGLGVR